MSAGAQDKKASSLCSIRFCWLHFPRNINPQYSTSSKECLKNHCGPLQLVYSYNKNIWLDNIKCLGTCNGDLTYSVGYKKWFLITQVDKIIILLGEYNENKECGDIIKLHLVDNL